MDRDRYLTEAMGGKWHEFSHAEKGPCGELQVCICGRKNYMMPCATPDFSTWKGFGLLWEWAQKQDWFDLFQCVNYYHEYKYTAGDEVNDNDGVMLNRLIQPNNFADAIYHFLKNN